MSKPAPTQAPKPTRTRRKEDRPIELLDAALELFAQKGYSATRAEEIAHRAGVSKGTLFLYFGTKEDLFEALVRQTVVSVVQDAQQFAARFTGSSSDLLRQLIKMWWQRAGSVPARVIPHLIITEAHHFPHCAAYYEHEVLNPCRQLTHDIVQRGIDSGEFRPLDLGLVWLSFHSLLTYPSVWQKAASAALMGDADMQAFVEHQCDMLICGLQAKKT